MRRAYEVSFIHQPQQRLKEEAEEILQSAIQQAQQTVGQNNAGEAGIVTESRTDETDEFLETVAAENTNRDSTPPSPVTGDPGDTEAEAIVRQAIQEAEREASEEAAAHALTQ